MRKVIGISVVAAILGTLLPAVARAGEWGGWQPMGDDVSVSFCYVDGNVWTWRFRNDGPTAIRRLEFKVTDRDGERRGAIPAPLAPGHAFGGPAAFTASGPATVELIRVDRR